MMRILLLVFLGVPLMEAGCPAQSDLPLTYNSNTFLCAKIYEHGHCDGAERSIYNYEHTSNCGSWWNDKVTSLVVRPGCQLRLWEHDKYEGWSITYTTMEDYLSRKRNDKITSWKCECEYTNDPLRCTATDEWLFLKRCDNPSAGAMLCTHSITKGMSLGHSATEGKSVSETSYKEMGKVYNDKFKAKGTSTTTQYNWSTTTTYDFERTTTTTVSCMVPPGESIVMEQVLGKCGDTNVFANYYRCASA